MTGPSSAPTDPTPVVALTIAGSDSSGGAGVQADLRTFAALGVHGASAFAALTAQNTVGVQDVLRVPAAFVEAQVASVLDDLDVRGVKTGMLATRENVVAVAALARAGRLPNLVVDPVMVASTGARLLDPDAETAYRGQLVPAARVVTPNRAEAEVLVGRPLPTLDDVRTAALELAGSGPEVVVITGGVAPRDDRSNADPGAGHADADSAATAIDVVVDAGGRVHELPAPRVGTGNDHGTGCSFAAATAARLALGDDPLDAIRAAKCFVHRALVGAAPWRLGAGHGPIDHLGWSAPAADGPDVPDPATPHPRPDREDP